MQTDIAHQRLFNQRIAGEKFQQPEDVVRWMGALQAQDYPQALWAIGLRMQSATRAAVEQAIEDRKIVRTWPMRGTLHFVPAEDAQWMLKLGAARALASSRRRREQLELDEATIGRARQLFENALQGGKRLTRPAMMQVLENAGIRTEGQRGYHVLGYLAQTGVLCLGPMEDKQQTFVLLDEWVPRARQLSREEALAVFTERYFASHGPATIQDFAGWAGITLTDARAGLEAAKAGLVSEKIDGQVYWMAAGRSARATNGSETGRTRRGQALRAEGQQAHTTSSIYLLPGFDEYLLGYKDRSAVLAAEHAPRIVPGGNGVFLPMIVIAGQVVGTWKRALGKKALNVAFIPFTSLGEAEAQAIEAAKAYSDFLGLPLVTRATL